MALPESGAAAPISPLAHTPMRLYLSICHTQVGLCRSDEQATMTKSSPFVTSGNLRVTLIRKRLFILLKQVFKLPTSILTQPSMLLVNNFLVDDMLLQARSCSSQSAASVNWNQVVTIRWRRCVAVSGVGLTTKLIDTGPG